MRCGAERFSKAGVLRIVGAWRREAGKAGHGSERTGEVWQVGLRLLRSGTVGQGRYG